MATSKKGCRVLKVFKALEGHPIIGISNKEISDGLGIPPASVSRDLEDLIADRFRQQHERLQSKIAEIGNRVNVD